MGATKKVALDELEKSPFQFQKQESIMKDQLIEFETAVLAKEKV